jgi:hypothetical protein
MEKKDVFETLAKVRSLYPDDIKRIDAESDALKELLAFQNYAEQEGSKKLLVLCRKQIIEARKKLATDKSLLGNEGAQRDLWLIIESRSWVLQFLAKDYQAEVDAIHDRLIQDLD